MSSYVIIIFIYFFFPSPEFRVEDTVHVNSYDGFNIKLFGIWVLIYLNISAIL